MSKYSGLKLVEWSPAGAGTWTSLGSMKSDSEHSPEAQAEEDSKGVELYAGTDDTYTINCYDLSKKAALRTEMLADNLVDLRFTDMDDAVTTESNFSVIVQEPKGFATKARNFFTARFKRVFI